MGEATEWDDILVKHGIKEPTIKQEDLESLVIETAAAYEDRKKTEKLEKASLDELDELEDDEDEKALAEYRRKRIEEMKQQALKNKFGELISISEPEYKDAVTEASQNFFVVVFLYKSGIPHCQLMEQKLRPIATKFKATKFVKIRSEEAIHNYPDKNLPTILVYHKGDIVKTIITLAPIGGESVTSADIEWALKTCGAVDSEMEEDPRKKQREGGINLVRGYVAKRNNENDSDSEDDY
eukprot:TRINITY_DN2671_c0_g3_i1.p1 TRINITY_DN2671_c0_g3~~TRINITY_DN2671_c0_g3_i1.p1  ORF type:complete len:239 (-),score=64.21 TRINITY_DN2671_c0_g3_i1:141-857(-)